MTTDMNAKDLTKLLKYLKTAPKKFAAAQTMWVNRAAFGSRDNILKHIKTTMIVRKESFLKSRIRVKKASGGSANREAIVGSVRAARHTGWAEQEGLKEDKRDKVITPAARGGNLRKAVRPSARLRKGRNHPTPARYPGKGKRSQAKTAHQRANAMLQVLGHTRTRKPFIVTGHRKLPSGLWRFGAGAKGKRKLEPLQLFKHRPARPQKNPWMSGSVKKYFKNMNRRRVWGDIIKRVDGVPKK